VFVLALDVGTSSVRALVYDEQGRQVEGAGAHERYTQSRGHSGRLGEFDADELVEAAREAIDEARREMPGRIDAVAASCFWHSLVAVDVNGRALTTVSTWRDTRAAVEAGELARELSTEAVHARTGCPLHPSFWPARLRRLKRDEPDVFRSAERFLSFPDYALLKLAGDHRTSVSMASGTGLLELESRTWDEELLEALDLDPGRLPEISDEPVGVREQWYPAVGDGACSNVGAGCVTADAAALMIGTSGAYRVIRGGEPAPRPGLFMYRVDEQRLVEGGSISDGGNLYDWLERTLSAVDTRGLVDEPADGHGLTFLTLLGGERSPGWNADARGAIAGLSFGTEPRHILQAALEGVALRFSEISELMPEVDRVVATGGALLENAGWVQILADALGRRVTLSAVAEASARGAAVVTLERLGESPVPAPLGLTFEPRHERTQALAAARERQRTLYRALGSPLSRVDRSFPTDGGETPPS